MDYDLSEDDLVDAAALAALDDWVLEDEAMVLSHEDMVDAAELAGMNDWVFDDVQAGGGGSIPEDFRVAEHVAVEAKGHRFSKTHNMRFKWFMVSVHDLDAISFIEAPAVIVAVLDYILATVLEGIADHQYVRVSVESAHLSFPIWTPPTLRSQLTVQRWMSEISKVLNSHQELVIGDSFAVSVEHTEIPSGRCVRDVPMLLYQKLKKMRSVIMVNNDDEICMARAFLIGKAFADGREDYAKHIAKGKREILALSKELIEDAGLPIREYTLADVAAFEKKMQYSDAQFLFFDFETYVADDGRLYPNLAKLDNTAKGLFPHRFNRPENWDQVTEFPSMEEYGYRFMNKKDRDSFKKWYEEEVAAKDNTFDISQRSSITIAGLCGLYWRTNILKANQIGLIPPQGYHTNRNQSVKALKWLQWMELEENRPIQTRASGAEFKVGQYFVDGYSASTGKVFEFHGCWYHGCPECTAPDTIHPFRNLPMSKIYEETVQRDARIRSMGHELCVIWEHEFDSLVKQEPFFAAFVEEITVRQPINPRDAFYGGRTNATKLFHRVKDNEKIRYFDVCSEYLYVNKNKRYPIGHPTIIIKDFDAITNYFGIIQCEVLPPADLNLPVLPYRSNGKLVFPLCRSCAQDKQNAPCTHTNDERVLVGTWCSPELHAAIDRGYVVKKIFEVWHFEQSEERLFADYIDRFLKIKTEASGWPADVATDLEKEQYLRDFHEHEGIELGRDKIESNPGIRALAKLCLNSFWGRLGMQDNKPNTKYISSPEEFYRMLLSGEYHIHSWDLFSDDVLQLSYTRESLFVEQNPHANVVLAAFTTCWARLHLYNYMEQVQDTLLYFDTDSLSDIRLR
ncbi:uncharacterized protein LOC129592933 [Paramacrobiotus metropolitanus]|uniref:uncharacterized protein LOC129592933 n=1 Tax=Paramacrobiotus metropolitanus TaxID=2943436 RepID=UPI0024464244|nr:uncharacterized protein LOC129592933 [Paramacrobiotus metropolitanus]